MSSPDNSPAYAPRGPSWAAVLKLLGWAAPFVIGAAMLYLGREFATHPEVREATLSFAPLPAKVQSLEEYRARDERISEQTAGQLKAVSDGLIALKATTEVQQHAQAQATNRILDQLDRIERRATRTTTTGNP